MRTLAPVLAALLLLAGCGGKQEAAAPASEPVTITPAGTRGPLIGLDGDGLERFSLDGGVAAADGSRYFTAIVTGAKTVLRGYRPSTGGVAASYPLDGAWRPAAASADGAYVVLSAARPTAGRSVVAVYDTGARRLQRISFAGRFEVDGIAADGDALFLVQTFADGRYAVRLYDLAARTLHRESIRVKNPDEVMAGSPGEQVATPDGTWLLTLFVNAAEHKSFVHALNLQGRYAMCLDLPGEGSPVSDLRGYGLALAPGGEAVFAPNPALDLVARIDLLEIGRLSSAGFDGGRGGGATTSAVSADGRTVYFARDRNLWAYDAAYGVVRGPYALDGAATRLAFAGRTLYVLGKGGTRRFDAATGAPLAS